MPLLVSSHWCFLTAADAFMLMLRADFCTSVFCPLMTAGARESLVTDDALYKSTLYITLHSVICCLKASLKLGLSEWSDKFSLDTVGSIGTVQCKIKDQIMTVSHTMLVID